MNHGHHLEKNWAGALTGAVGAALLAACAASTDPVSSFDDAPENGTGSGGGEAVTTGTGGSDGLGGGTIACSGVFEAGAAGDDVTAAELAVFDAPSGGSAPFVFDPPPGALLPEGWPAPAFLVHTDSLPAAARLELAVGELRSEIVLHPEPAAKAHADSVVAGSWWTIAVPEVVWDAAKCAGTGSPVLEIGWRISYAFEGAATPAGASQGELRLLRDQVAPDVSYWQITEQGVHSIERLAVGAKPQSIIQKSQCIGCHAASPDGQDFAIQTSGDVGWVVQVLRPDPSTLDAPPSPVVSASAQAMLGSTSLMVPAAAAELWSDDTGRFLTAVTGSTHATPGRVALLQIDATDATLAVGPPLGGEKATLAAATPALAPDGSRVLFVATDAMIDGYFAPVGFVQSGASADLWQVPVTLAKDVPAAIGAPSPIPFASGTPENETFPTLSPDGELLAFMRSAPGRGGYDEVTGTIWVMPADGSEPPIAITGNQAPGTGNPGAPVFQGMGLTNSWPRFGQTVVETVAGKYYFLVFSSRRGPADLWEARLAGSADLAGRPIAHLYLATIFVGTDGSIQSSAATYLPGQRVDAGAHTAAFTTVTAVPPPPADLE